MIRKTLCLLVLAALGYFGYLVWGQLTPEEKTLVGDKVAATAQSAGQWATNAARSLTEAARKAME